MSIKSERLFKMFEKYIIEIETGNASFNENPFELSYILLNLSKRFKDHSFYDGMKIIDTNGNCVGNVKIGENKNV